MSDEAKETYNLPYGIDGWVEDPTQLPPTPAGSIRNGILGRNAAVPYRITEAEIDAATNPAAFIHSCDVQKLRDQYLVAPAPEPIVVSSNRVNGPRTRRELFAALRNDPWHRGARKMQNEKGFSRKLG